MSTAERVTLRRIAKEAEVSTTTVSLALAGSSQISDATRARISRLSRQLNYRPRRKRAAEAVQSRRFGLVVVGEADYEAQTARQIRHVSTLSRESSIKLEISTVPEMGEQAIFEHLERIAADTDGVLLLGVLDHAFLDRLVTLPSPCVFMGLAAGDPLRPVRGCHVVSYDVAAMGQIATAAVLEAGHRRIGFFCNRVPEGLWFDQWLTGYRRAHTKAGVEVDPSLVFLADRADTGQVGSAAAEYMLNLERPATAYVVPSEAAAGFMACMRSAGGSVSPDVFVVGGMPENLQQYGLETFAAVTVDQSASAQACLSLLEYLADGGHMVPAVHLMPFETRAFDRIAGPNDS